MLKSYATQLDFHGLLDLMEAEFNRHVESFKTDFRHDICFILRELKPSDWDKIVEGEINLFYSVGEYGSHIGITSEDKPLWFADKQSSYRECVHYKVCTQPHRYGAPALILTRVYTDLTSAKYAA